MKVIDKIFGDPNLKEIRKLQPQVEKINHWEKKTKKLSDAGIKKRFLKIKSEVEDKIGKQLINISDKKIVREIELNVLEPFVPEVFSLIREAAKRTIGQRHYDVQLIGGLILHSGRITEMKTGEGKTLVATLAVGLNALTGKGVHVVTVNDYLARRDAGWMGQIYDFLGLTTATIVHDKAFIFDREHESGQVLDEKTSHLREVTRKEAYNADITYGTNNEFGFDYLRDNMAQSLDQMVQRPLHFAIVDEVDSILIDEARTPLIISAPAEEATEKYYQFSRLVRQLKEGNDFIINEKDKASMLTDEGISHMEKLLGVDNIYESFGIENVRHIEQALKAETLFKKDRDYVVKDGEIIIVDEFTGRLMFGRRYSEGLHQAIEAKEGVEIKQESITLATISFQNYFRLYLKLSGMTGTATTEAEEFHKIYDLDVLIVPTHRPMVRKDMADLIYKNEKSKFQAIVEDVKERHQKGQPILIGTVSIEKNELLADLLKREGVPHEILNAKNHEKEALIISKAGLSGSVTVATNMAGRGTDIVLDAKAITAGGLHVIGTERHESRRIDNQLRGRSGRQGDPGSSQFFVSLEDDLMRIFGSDKVGQVMSRLGLPDDIPIQHALINKSLEQAQKRVESQNFDIRKHLVEYDDIMNRQREYIYEKRRRALGQESLKEEFLDFFDEEAENIVNGHINIQTEEIDFKSLVETIRLILPLGPKDENAFTKDLNAHKATGLLRERFREAYAKKEKETGPDLMGVLERAFYLRTIDMLWVDHLDAMDHLREGIGLRGYGQKDPLIEYKNESYQMFQKLLAAIRSEIVSNLFKVTISREPIHQDVNTDGPKEAEENSAPDTTRTSSQTKAVKSHTKAGRNDPCPCGSGKKFKKCCGR